MKRALVFGYGVISYLIFLATFLYALGFIGNFLVPVSLDSPSQGSALRAVLIDVLLLGVFALQHSIMARPAFKRWWTRIIPQAAERSTYVLASSLALLLLFKVWQPVGWIVWNVQDPLGTTLLYAAFAFGWGLVLYTTFLIDHFDLFGLRQVWLHLRGLPHTGPAFRQPSIYKHVRHPLYVGWLFAFWCTPTMTGAHLLFALATSAYILIAIRFEERDLVAEHGPAYERYRQEVPMLIPRLRRTLPLMRGTSSRS